MKQKGNEMKCFTLQGLMLLLIVNELVGDFEKGEGRM